MSRMVFCRKYQRDMEGLDFAPFPTPKGQELFETVSKQAWQEWLKHQTLLINEKRLMGRFTNGRGFNVLAWVMVAVLILLTLILIVVSVFPGLLG